jgi:prepilin-type N-terminal cleavage/methylation domain-containing protein
MPRRAFTIIEILVATIILVVLAAAVVPRVAGLGWFSHDSAMTQMEQVLAMFAYRESSGTQQVALMRDGETGDIALVVMKQPPGLDAEAQWEYDTMVKPFRVPGEMELVAITADGQELDPREWMIASIPSGGRPEIVMTWVGPSGETELRLPATQLIPRRADNGVSLVAEREGVDLDSSGLTQEDW